MYVYVLYGGGIYLGLFMGFSRVEKIKAFHLNANENENKCQLK